MDTNYMEVVDEFTYYANGSPKVSNANVTILDMQGNLFSFRITSSNGTVDFSGVPEGFY